MAQVITRLPHTCGIEIGAKYYSCRYNTNFTVLKLLEERSKERRLQYLCVDDSGNEKIVTGKALLRLRQFRKPLVDRVKKQHPLYRIYSGMKTRCYDKNSVSYRWWGARGITICDRWLESFWNFVEDMGERPEGYTIERLDNDRGYCPENCVWVTIQENNKNRRPNSGWIKKKCQQ